MYDSKTLADIQMRIAKGWVIRRDEMAMLLKMAVELASLKEKGSVVGWRDHVSVGTNQPNSGGALMPYRALSTEAQIGAVIKSWAEGSK